MTATTMPGTLTPDQREQWRRYDRLDKQHLVWQLRRDLPHDLRMQVRTRLTKVQLLNLAVLGTIPEHVRAVKPEAPPVQAPEPFVMPGPDATRDEMIAALTALDDWYVATLQAVRQWALGRGRGASRRLYCAGGMNDFFKKFGLPEYRSPRDYGFRKAEHAEPRQIARPVHPDFRADYLTDEGLRWALENRHERYQGVFAEMREFGVRNRGWFTMQQLNEGLAIIGQPPYVPPQYASVSASVTWQLPDDGHFSADEEATWKTAARRALREALDGLTRDGWTTEARNPLIVSAEVQTLN